MPRPYRLPLKLEQRLDTLAHQTGRSVATLTREAVLAEIEVIEDYYRAAARARRGRQRRRLPRDTLPATLQ